MDQDRTGPITEAWGRFVSVPKPEKDRLPLLTRRFPGEGGEGVVW